MTPVMSDSGRSLQDIVHNHDLILLGNPLNSKDQPGLIMRIDRLEQNIQKGFSRSWKINSAVVSGLVILIQVLVRLLGV